MNPAYSAATIVVLLLVGIVSCDNSPEPPSRSSIPTKVAGAVNAASVLEGTWQVVSVEAMGEPTSAFVGSKMIITKDTVTWYISDLHIRRNELKTNSEVDPKWLDQCKNGRQLELGIYKFQGDRLVICSADAGHPRPPTFTTGKDNHRMLTVLKRLDDDSLAHLALPTISGNEFLDKAISTKFVWRELTSRWEADLVLRGHSVLLSVDLGDPPNPAHRNRDRLRAIVEILKTSDQSYRSFAAATLLNVYNDDLNSGEPIGHNTFCERLQLNRVSVFGDGDKHIYFDSDMFRDHIVQVILFSDLEPEHASIEAAGTATLPTRISKTAALQTN
jgi:uncharacterized protein (TIGR03067 family)